METLSVDWIMDSASALEPLQPVSSEWCHTGIPDIEYGVEDIENITNLDFNVEKLSRGKNANKLLADLDRVKDETEPFYDWLDSEKTASLPIFDDLPSLSCFKIQNDVKQTHSYATAVDDNVFSKSMYSQPDEVFGKSAFNVSYLPAAEDLKYFSACGASQLFGIDNITSSLCVKQEEAIEIVTSSENTKEEEILKLLQGIEADELEELVRTRVECLTDSSMSSMHDDFSDYVSSPLVNTDSSMDDPLSSPSSFSQVVPNLSSKASGPVKRKRTYRTYSKTPVEDKKLRKKEQNKNAATRYRLKKKAEVEEIITEEKELEDRNELLREQANEIGREIKYLKSLMRDMYKAKGIIK